MADGKKATVAEAHSDISAIFIIKPHGYATEESISDHLDTLRKDANNERKLFIFVF